jgi:hypothetical protein
MVGCSTINITTDYALEQDFDGYRSYQWHPDGTAKSASLEAMGGDIFDTRVRRLLEQTLADKGLVQSATADFYLNYSVVTEDRVSINTYNTYGGYGPGWGYYGYGGFGPWGVGSTQTSVHYYTQGTVIIDVVDAASNKLVWRSSADSRVDNNSTPEQKERNLRKAFAKMFEKFPPPPPAT